MFFHQLRPLRDGSQDDLRTVIGDPGFFNCFGGRELRQVPPSVACMAPDSDGTDAYANLTANQVYTLHMKRVINAELHYTGTCYGHVVQHQRTPPTDELTTNCRCCTTYASVAGKFVVQHLAGFGHHQRTSSQQFYNLLYNKFTTNGQKFATSQHPDMSGCWALALQCGKFVVQQVAELL